MIDLLLLLDVYNVGRQGQRDRLPARRPDPFRPRRRVARVAQGELQLVGGNAEPSVYGNILLSRTPADPKAFAFAEWNFTTGDPRLGSDHAPQAGSPGIGAAKVDASRRPDTDLAGKKRPAGCAIGAREPSP